MNTTVTSIKTNQVGSNPTHEQIALLAYQIWEQVGRKPGHALADWLEAEKQLKRAGSELLPAIGGPSPRSAPQNRPASGNGPRSGNQNRVRLNIGHH